MYSVELVLIMDSFLVVFFVRMFELKNDFIVKVVLFKRILRSIKFRN